MHLLSAACLACKTLPASVGPQEEAYRLRHNENMTISPYLPLLLPSHSFFVCQTPGVAASGRWEGR